MTRALMIFALACSPKAEPEPDGPATVDGDNDGVAVGLDCDDADASVYPGAQDVWYDGVDSDCGGENDDDADGDGVAAASSGGADCDDADPAVYPGATEVWYDGVDGDCRGDNDDDADQDGFSAEVVGGPDCDDEATEVYPGAADLWYDGVDSDCDDRSDYDADEDGYDASAELEGGLDCDDYDPDVNPEATEVWYDGTDADCAGDDDYDADRDGASSIGADCDDTDPQSYPGAAEQLDGHDTDCDGVGDRFGVEADYSGSFVQGTDADDGLGAALDLADTNADGFADLLIAETGPNHGPGGAAFLLDGVTLAGGPTTTALASATLITTAATGSLGAVRFLADFAGGSAPLIGLATDQGGGRLYLFTATELAIDPNRTLAEAGRTVSASAAGTGFGAAFTAASDMDGDGFGELLVGAPDSAGGAVKHFDGSGLLVAAALVEADADHTWSGSLSSADLAGSALLDLGDLTGDGYGDLAVGAPGLTSGAGGVYLMAGGLTLTSGTLAALSYATFTGVNSNDQAGAAIAAGDLNGDGVVELIVGAPRQVTQAGRVHAIDGAGIRRGSLGLASAAYVNHSGTTVFGNAGAAVSSGADVDGDGLHDLVVGGPGDAPGGGGAGAAWLVISGRSGARALADADGTFLGSLDDAAGTATALGDINGDGLGDVVFGVPGEDTFFGGEGAVYVGFSGYDP
jgi:hypothetical protein